MNKKNAIRKLNRTLLKKESTNESYLTGKNTLIPFFDFNNIEQLETSRTEDTSRYTFVDKKDRNIKRELSVTKENNEVRVTGFGDFFDLYGLTEVDSVILECIELQGEKEYLLDYKKDICRVLQKYDSKDNTENYSICKNEKGKIQFEYNIDIKDECEGAFWLWDDHFDEDCWNQLIGKQINAVLIIGEKVKEKKIRIIDTGLKFEKLLKAKSRSKNDIITQTKTLYKVEQLLEGEWKEENFDGKNIIEIFDEKFRLKFTDRNSDLFSFHEGGRS